LVLKIVLSLNLTIKENVMATFIEKLDRLREDALKFITSVLEQRGTGYELCDPSDYEDGFEDDTYLRVPVTKEHGIDYEDKCYLVVINIKDGLLEFEGISLAGDDEHKFTPMELETEVILELADLVKSLES